MRGFRSSRGDRGAAAARGDVDSVSRSGAISKRRFLGRGAGGRGDTHSRQYWWTLERSSLHAHGVGRKNSSEPFASHVVSQQMRHTGAAREAEEEEACIAPGARAATDDGRGAGGTSARGVRPESERRADPRRVDGRAVNGRGPTPRAPARVRAGAAVPPRRRAAGGGKRIVATTSAQESLRFASRGREPWNEGSRPSRSTRRLFACAPTLERREKKCRRTPPHPSLWGNPPPARESAAGTPARRARTPASSRSPPAPSRSPFGHPSPPPATGDPLASPRASLGLELRARRFSRRFSTRRGVGE